MKKTGKLKDECFDMADAIVISRAHAEVLRRDNVQGKKSS